MSKLINDDYPRGRIYTTSKDVIKGTRIDIKTNHILFTDPSINRTVLIPFDKIEHISYSKLPKAIIEQRERLAKEEYDRANTPKDNSNRG